MTVKSVIAFVIIMILFISWAIGFFAHYIRGGTDGIAESE